MPQISRKRRSDAISRDASPSASPEPQQSQHHSHRRSPSAESALSSSSAGGADATETQAVAQRTAFVKKLVRLALASEYSRAPLRRSDITAKVFKDNSTTGASSGRGSGAGFKAVFEDAQKVLRGTFGMELQELPFKEKMGLKERRAQVSQASGRVAGGAAGNRSWILVSVLPRRYQEDLGVVVPSHAPSQEAEAGYAAFYSFVVALIYLNNGEITEQRLERFLRRVNADTQTAWGALDKVKTRMVKEGYMERKRDATGGEEVISFTVGPRGKTEVGTKGVEGLVRSVYGLGAAGEGHDGPKIEEAELVKRLNRSLGARATGYGDETPATGGGSAGASATSSRQHSKNGTPQPQQQRKRAPRRRAARDDDDDDDDE